MFSFRKQARLVAPFAFVFALACDATGALEPAGALYAKPGSSASNPHWLNGTDFNFATQTFEFRAAGVGTNQIVEINVSAVLNLSYACADEGGIVTVAQPVTQALSATQTFESHRKGNLQGSVSLISNQSLGCGDGLQPANIEVQPGGTVSVTVNPAYLPALQFSN